MKEIILTLAICLILTLILELAAALVIGIRKGFDLLVITFTNTLTNPLAVLVGMLLSAFTGIPRLIYIILIELLVFITEALIYKKLLYSRKLNPFIVSLILNGVSFFIGTTIAAKVLEMLI